MRHFLLAMSAIALVSIAWSAPAAAQANDVQVIKDDRGMKLQVDGQDFLVRGMNWGYIPIGSNYSYDLWGKPDDFIKRVLDSEMAMLQRMGVNAIRLFNNIPPRWVEYVYDNYGIMVAVNHLLGRYGFEHDGVFVPNTNYADPKMRRAILEDVERTVARYKDTRGVLMFLLGNENNYGLQWTSFEIEDVPDEVNDPRADQLYSLWCEAASVVSRASDKHPVAIVNGDLQYLDLVKRHCKDLDILGSNMYRGASAGDAYQRVKDELGLPFMYTEFGSDAYNAREDREDSLMQARYLKAQWREIYEQSYGKGAEGNALGGMIFQWSDGWWKYKQEENLDVHDTTAQWATGAYDDFQEGLNNMNEEWWGIAAKNPSDSTGFYTVTPRTAYFVLREAFTLDPYAPDTTTEKIHAHFDRIDATVMRQGYIVERNRLDLERLRSIRLSGVSLLLDASVSQGNRNTTRGDVVRSGHTEAYTAEVSFEPSSALQGRVVVHGVGSVANNRLDNVFYEQRALELTAASDDSIEQFGSVTDRFAIYEAEFKISQQRFDLEGFYRVGHLGWGYEGDFFNLYPEAFYGENLDIYNGQGPLGMSFTGKKELRGLKISAGPELWWGANPAVIAKYQKNIAGWRLAIIHHEDVAQRQQTATSFAIPAQINRRSSLYLGRKIGPWDLELGGLMAGSPRIGDEFTYTRETSRASYANSGYEVFSDTVKLADTLGGRARATLDVGELRWFVQGSLMGLVADGGYNYTTVVTGWQLKESGRGNHWGGSSGASIRVGHVEIAPKVMYHKPLIAANPLIPDQYIDDPGLYFPAVRPRNFLDDPFAVLENRETLAGELMIVYDPTPGTWWHRWDRAVSESSRFAAALDIWYQHLPTPRDSNIFTLATGDVVSFGQAPEPADEWQAAINTVFVPSPKLRINWDLFVGRTQPRNFEVRAPDDLRYGTNLRLWIDRYHFQTRVAFFDYGRYDFHRDFNLIYPFQFYFDGSWGLKPVGLEMGGTRIGARAQFRTLDERSLDYVSTPDTPNALGVEWEAGIYGRIEL